MCDAGNRADRIVIMLIRETAAKTESLRAPLAYPDLVFCCVEKWIFAKWIFAERKVDFCGKETLDKLASGRYNHSHRKPACARQGTRHHMMKVWRAEYASSF